MVVFEEYYDDGGYKGYQSLKNMQGKYDLLGFIVNIEIQGFSSKDFVVNELA